MKFSRIILYELYSTDTFFSCVIIYIVPEKVRSNKKVFLTFTVSWNTAVYSLVDVYRCFGGTCCLHFQGRRNYHVIRKRPWRILLLVSDSLFAHKVNIHIQFTFSSAVSGSSVITRSFIIHAPRQILLKQ